MRLIKLEDDYLNPYAEDDGLGAARGIVKGLAIMLAIVTLVACLWVLMAIG